LRLLIDQANRQAVLDLAGIGWPGDLDAMREGRDWDYAPEPEDKDEPDDKT